MYIAIGVDGKAPMFVSLPVSFTCASRFKLIGTVVDFVPPIIALSKLTTPEVMPDEKLDVAFPHHQIHF